MTFLNVAIGLVAVLISAVGYYLVTFYSSRKNYPPGPFPLPVIGNILLFRQKGKHLHQIFEDLAKEYGSVYTFYIGDVPQVIVSDTQLSHEVMKKHQFAGRPKLPGSHEYYRPGTIDLIMADFTKEWELLRKVSHSALRKYATGDKLPQVVADVVDEVLENVMEGACKGEPIDMKKWLYKTLHSILATSAYGKRYTFDDPELNKWIEIMEKQAELSSQMELVAYVPITKIFFRSQFKELMETVQFQWDYAEKNFNEHLETFEEGTIRDFTDALLVAKKEAEEENDTKAIEWLKTGNIMNAIEDMFTAGSHTSRAALQWAFLLMTTYPDYQRRLREEVEEQIGLEDIPNLSHRSKCHFCAAFIAEILRFRPIVPFNLPHKALSDTELGGFSIKKDTAILPLISPAMHDDKIWDDPEVFRPERFLDSNQQFVPKPTPFYTPFSDGRRTCPGQKVALADIFFIIARFLQKTTGYEFALPDGPGSVDLLGNTEETDGWVSHDYQLVLKQL